MPYASDLDRELNEMAEAELRGAPAVVMPTTVQTLDEKNLAMITHVATIAAAVFSGGLFHVFVPAVAYALFQDKSAFLKDHAKAQLNFQITSLAVALAAVIFCVVTLGIGVIVAVPALVAFFLCDVIFSIRAALAASRGEAYEFPFSLELIK